MKMVNVGMHWNWKLHKLKVKKEQLALHAQIVHCTAQPAFFFSFSKFLFQMINLEQKWSQSEKGLKTVK